MPPEAALPAHGASPAAARAPDAAWPGALLRLGGAWLVLLAVFLDDWLAMARQWWDSSTYNHILLVPPIIGWLVHLRWPVLRLLEPRPWWPGLLPLAGGVAVWMLGAFSGLDLARHIGAVAMLGAMVPALLGPRVAAGLAFPLGYMAFLVPFGDELVPPLQSITAELTIFLTHLSGIPATVEGVFIDTPAGLFEVAEACSGVKFLVAMVAFGALVANVCFTSWRRRAVFMAISVIVPILANGVRAWGTIQVAQFKGAEYAGGFDHIVYGWLFFAVVIALVFALSWRWFDRAVDDPMIDPAALNGSALLGRLERLTLGAAPLLALAGALVLGGQGWARAADRLEAAVPRQVFLPDVPGWQRVDVRPYEWWEPRASGADHRLLGRYRDTQGRTVDVFFALYAAQGEGREAGGFGEGALTPGSPWSWVEPGPAAADAKSDRLRAENGTLRTTRTYYRTGPLLTGSNARLKLANMADRLLLRARPTMLLILSAEEVDGNTPASIDAFGRATGPLDRWMDRAAGLR